MLQQVLERKNEVLCVLTQKIVTTRTCVISEHVQIEEKCGGMVGIQTKTCRCAPSGWRCRVRGHGGLGQGPLWVGSSFVRILSVVS